KRACKIFLARNRMISREARRLQRFRVLHSEAVVRKLLLLFVVCAGVASLLPGRAAADDSCTPPDGVLTWIDTAPPDLVPVFARPGLVIAAGSGDFPAQLRQAGAVTIHYDNYLRSRAGLPTTP